MGVVEVVLGREVMFRGVGKVSRIFGRMEEVEVVLGKKVMPRGVGKVSRFLVE